MEGIALKNSCDSCVASKLKCSGGQPCVRCKSKNIDCFYRPRKKRAPTQPKQPDSKTTIMKVVGSVTPAPSGVPIQTLSLFERRSWSTFFTLYKNYNASCSRYWFNRQLGKLHRNLARMNKLEALNRLTAWMEALDIDYKKLNDENSTCMTWLRENAKTAGRAITTGQLPHFHIPGTLVPAQNPQVMDMDSLDSYGGVDEAVINDKKIVAAKLHCGHADEDVVVNVSERFNEIFHRTSEELTKDMKENSLLPWGIDLFASFCAQEDDLLAFIQILCIKFNNCKKTYYNPYVREIPSCSIFEFNVPGFMKPIPCLVKTVHRQLVNLEKGMTLDMIVTFEFLQPFAIHAKNSTNTTTTTSSSIISNNNDKNKLTKLSNNNNDKLIANDNEISISLPFADMDDASTPSTSFGSDSPTNNDVGMVDEAIFIPEIDTFLPENGPLIPDEDWFNELLDWTRADDGVQTAVVTAENSKNGHEGHNHD